MRAGMLPTSRPAPAEAIVAWAPIAIVAVGAAVPALRPWAFVAVVAGWSFLRWRGRQPLPAAWLASLPAAAILGWTAIGAPEVAVGLAACADPVSPAAIRRVAEMAVALVAVAVLYRTRPPGSSLGFGLPRDRRVIALAIGAPIVLVPASLWVGPALAGPFFGRIGLATSDPAALLPAAIFAVANAVAEETAYRGAMIGWAAPGLGVAGAIVGQAIVFGFAHLGPDVTGWAPILWLGMATSGAVAGVVAVRTRSLLLPIAAHAAFDVPMYYALACRA